MSMSRRGVQDAQPAFGPYHRHADTPTRPRGVIFRDLRPPVLG